MEGLVYTRTCVVLFLLSFAALLLAPTVGADPEEGGAVGQCGDMSIIVIVGGGLAGLSAALEASTRGAKVILLDKEKRIGGNSAKATSGINAALTDAQGSKIELKRKQQSQQPAQGDSNELFAQDILASGGDRASPELVRFIAGKSKEAVEWLETFGLDLSVVAEGGGHQFPRTHRLASGAPLGWTIVSTLQKAVEAAEGVEVWTATKVTGLIVETAAAATVGDTAEDEVVVGVKYQKFSSGDGGGGGGGGGGEGEAPSEGSWGDEQELRGAAVILTTGGFAFDRSKGSLLAAHSPDKLHLPTTSGPQATGDGIHLASAAGARLVDLDQVQVHPTSLVDPKNPLGLSKFLAPEAMRGEGGILVDGMGRRFVNELTLRSTVTQAIYDHGVDLGGDREGQGEEEGAATRMRAAYLLMSEEAAEAFGTKTLGFYQSKGLVQKAEGVQDIAVKLGLAEGAEEQLRSTFAAYTAVATATSSSEDDGGLADPFGKTVFPTHKLDADGVFYMAIVTPAIHYTMGGVSIDTDGRVSRNSNHTGSGEGSSEGNREGGEGGASEGAVPVQGLFAAGEVTGGVHGANRLVGNSLLECVVMGRVAGGRAAERAAVGDTAAAAAAVGDT